VKQEEFVVSARLFSIRTLLVVIVAVLLAAATYGFAAGNTVPASSAGDGNNTISGYTVASVAYQLNSTNPANIDAVTFQLSGGAGKPTTVKIKLVTAGSDWYACTSPTASAPYVYTCATTAPQATVLAADNLRVIAVQ
jgi:hypothetical protein